MYVYKCEQNRRCYRSEVEGGAVFIGLGPMENMDDSIVAINWRKQTYDRKQTKNIRFPAKWYHIDTPKWELYRE